MGEQPDPVMKILLDHLGPLVLPQGFSGYTFHVGLPRVLADRIYGDLRATGLLVEPGERESADRAWKYNAKLHIDMRRRIQQVATPRGRRAAQPVMGRRRTGRHPRRPAGVARRDSPEGVMSDLRWTNETEILGAQTLHLGACDGAHPTECPFWTHHIERSRAYLATLADAGLLVEPGGETRTEWGIGWTAPVEALSPGPRVNEADDEHHAREVVAGQPAHINTHVVSRTVYTGPWREQS